VNRRAVPAAALLAAAGLLLTACGSDDGGKGDDKIKGAGGGSPSKSASPTASQVRRPKITLPSDYKDTFTPVRTGDAVKDAVLSDNAERIRAVDAAIAGTDPKHRGIAFYNSGRALLVSQDWVGQFEKGKLGITGVTRYYQRKVTMLSAAKAALVYCGDEGKGYAKDLKTGKAKVTPVTRNSYVLYNTRLEKSADGVWKTTAIISKRGAAQCQR
jgi:hypothetical protein